MYNSVIVMQYSYIQIMVSCSHSAEAEAILHHLLKQRWVACGQILPEVHSSYHWRGGLDSSKECLLLLKTKMTLFDVIEKDIRALHSYDVPEIVAVPLVAISSNYQKWIDEEIIEK